MGLKIHPLNRVWDLNMENRPVETYSVHDYLKTKLCPLYENDCIFDKFECCWSGNDNHIITGSYNNFFRTFNRTTGSDVTLEASPDIAKPRSVLRPKRVVTPGAGGAASASGANRNHGLLNQVGPKKKAPRIAPATDAASSTNPATPAAEDEVSPDSLDYTKKILHTAWHPVENIVAVAATNNLYVFQDRL